MKKNIGIQDANIRTLAAAAIILVAFFLFENPYVRIVSALIAAILAATAFLRICPLYHFMHKNTCQSTEPMSPGPVDAPETTSDTNEPREPVA